MIANIMKDLRHALRSLWKAPRFTVIAVFTLALGIGANTAIFSVVNGILLRPLDYPEPDQLVNVWSTAPGLGYDQFPLSPDVFFHYQKESPAFAEMTLYEGTVANLTQEGGEPERIDGLQASHTLARVLGVEPLYGRAFSAEEDLPDAQPVVVLSEGLWERRFASDPSVVGKTVQLDGVTREVVGVMPEGFDRALGGDAVFWLPLGMDPEDPPAGTFGWNAFARLAPGLTPEQAQAQLVPVVARFAQSLQETPDGENYAAFLENGNYAPMVHSMKEDMVGSLDEPLWILLGTVGFVLLIACANVANLVLIRAEGRRRETAVRVAVGASRASLTRHYLAESVVLAGAGAALGLLVAWVGVPLVLRQAPPDLPRVGEVTVDGTVLLFTLAVAALATALFGVFPALRYTRPEALGALKQGGRGTTGPDRHRGRKLLVAAQMSLALVLLVGSGLLVRSFREILASDLGFATGDRLTFGLFLPETRYATPSDVASFHERLQERLEALPGVRSVGVVSGLPLAQAASGTAFNIEDQPNEPGQLPPMIHYVYAGPGYLEAMGISLLQGRTLSAGDHRSGEGVIVVSRTVAEKFWPNGEVLGRRLRPTGDTARWYTVVGVVERVLQQGVREESQPLVYYPMMGPAGDEGWDLRGAAYVVEAADPSALSSAVRAAVWQLDPDLPVADVRTMEDIVAEDMVQLSFTMFTLGMAALLALVLGAVGLYGVLSYSVAQRTQEIGVRMALGARASQVLSMVVRDGARTQGLGLIVGLAGAAALTRLLKGLLYGVEPLDPLTFAGMTAVLFGVGLLAAYVPARRAARLDPSASMRNE